MLVSHLPYDCPIICPPDDSGDECDDGGYGYGDGGNYGGGYGSGDYRGDYGHSYGSGCVDSSGTATDLNGHDCALYALQPLWCGRYDDSDFRSNEMCCGCRGGGGGYGSGDYGGDNHYGYGGYGEYGDSYGEDGTILIDDQFAPLSGKIEAAVSALGAQPVGHVINTHWHGDHTGGNEHFGEAGALIFAHHNVRERMSTEQRRGERVTPASPDAALPVVTYGQGIRIHRNGIAISA